ncbi:MAG: hypothetical protein ACLPSL_00700 [Smithella sp.]|jgi:hypothetical protein
MKMEKTTADKIIFLRDWISKNVTTENLERLLYGLEYENVLQVDLIPEEIFHDLCGSNVSPIPAEMVPKLQKAYPEYNWADLADLRGAAIINA